MATFAPLPEAYYAVTPPEPTASEPEKADYMKLPCPVPYDEINREAIMSLRPELFEGFRLDFMKGLDQNFCLTHNLLMGNTEIPHQSKEVIKIPTANYMFGANYRIPKLTFAGRLGTDGTLNAKLNSDLTENLTLDCSAQLTDEPHMSNGMFSFDYKGSDYRSQFQVGCHGVMGANYIQSVTPHFSLGGEVFWIGEHRKSSISFGARYNSVKMVASAQVASSGILALNYVQKVSDKVSLASDFMYNYKSKDVTASFGYDLKLQQCRLRGKVDSNGVVSAFLEERLNMGLAFLLSAEIDHKRKDYKFGFGFTTAQV